MSDTKFLTREEVQNLFAKLTVAYGVKFRERWQDVPWEAVMADWAERLGEFTGDAEAIAEALRRVNPAFPPTAMEFKELCQSAVNARERERDEQLRREYERLLTPEGMEWVWVPLAGCVGIGQPTRKVALRPKGSGFAPAPVPDVVRQRARLALQERDDLAEYQRVRVLMGVVA